MPDILDRTQGLQVAKKVFVPKIRQAWNFLTGLKDLFDKEAPRGVRISDAGGVLTLDLAPNMRGGFYGDGGPLSYKGAGTRKQVEFGFTNFNMAVAFTGQQLDALDREGPYAYANILSYEIETTLKAHAKLFNRFIMFDERAIYATASAAVNNSTTFPTGSGDRAYYVPMDAEVSVIKASDGSTIASGLIVQGFGANLTSVTLSSAVTCSQGDFLVPMTSYGKGLYGLQYHGYRPNWLGLDRTTTYTNLLGININAGGNDISANYLQQLASTLFQQGAEVEKMVLLWGPDQDSKYKAAGYSLIRFQPGDVADLGFHGSEFAPFKILLERDAPAGTVMSFVPNQFFWTVVKELDWGTADGRELAQLYQTTTNGQVAVPLDQYVSHLIWRGQLLTDRPHHIGMISNLNFDTIFRSRSHTSFNY